MKILRLMTVLLALTGCLLPSAVPQNGDSQPLSGLPLQFAATAFGQAGALAGKSFGVTVFVTAWTTDQQLNDYVSTLKEKGPNGLVSAMEKTDDVGRLSPTGTSAAAFASPAIHQQRMAACISSW